MAQRPNTISAVEFPATRSASGSVSGITPDFVSNGRDLLEEIDAVDVPISVLDAEPEPRRVVASLANRKLMTLRGRSPTRLTLNCHIHFVIRPACRISQSPRRLGWARPAEVLSLFGGLACCTIWVVLACPTESGTNRINEQTRACRQHSDRWLLGCNVVRWIG